MPNNINFVNFQKREKYWKFRFRHRNHRKHKDLTGFGFKQKSKPLQIEHTVEHKIAFLGKPNTRTVPSRQPKYNLRLSISEIIT